MVDDVLVGQGEHVPRQQPAERLEAEPHGALVDLGNLLEGDLVGTGRGVLRGPRAHRGDRGRANRQVRHFGGTEETVGAAHAAFAFRTSRW